MSLRTLKESETLGERLKKRREALNLSEKDVVNEIQAPLKYIRGLENDDYSVFSAKIYALGYLKKLIRAIAIEDPQAFLKEFGTEWEVRMFRKNKGLQPLLENRGEKPLVTPLRLGLGIGGVALLGFLLFFGFRLMKFVGTPDFTLEEPRNGMEFTEPVVLVRGRVEKESSLTVNGRELKIDEQGRFDEKIELAPGVHVLEFIVKNRFGKITKETRSVIIK
jgi:transcriptional regulator with XRE-family HTH domain